MQADVLSSELQSQASSLVEQILLTLERATTAFQRLLATVALQNQTQSTVEVIETTLYPLEELASQASEALDNATRDVPVALAEATRALAAILNVSLQDFNFDSRRREVADLEEGVARVGSLVDDSSLLLDTIRGNFSVLNATASRLLSESQDLNEEAIFLLNRSREALLLANQSISRGNDIITEAEDLLRQIRAQFRNARSLSDGLEEVILVVEEAEEVSAMAASEAATVDENVRMVAITVNFAVSLLEESSLRLNETMAVSFK